MSARLPVRHDYAFPLRVNAALRQAERADYPHHVAQMIRQFLLTSPGERVCRPDFGGGLRSLIFAPLQAGLGTTTEMLIRGGLQKYLGDHIEVASVRVSAPSPIGDSTVEITVEYVLLETQSAAAVTVLMN